MASATKNRTNTSTDGSEAPKLTKEQREAKKVELFRKLASKRTTEVLKRMDVLGNCSNRNTYTYTPEQVDRIFETLYKRLDDIRAGFTKQTSKSESFSL